MNAMFVHLLEPYIYIHLLVSDIFLNQLLLFSYPVRFCIYLNRVDLVAAAGVHLSAPGVEGGATLNQYKTMFQVKLRLLKSFHRSAFLIFCEIV